MNKHLKLAYDLGAQQALRDLGLEKTAAVPGPGFLNRLGLSGLGHMPFLPKMPGTPFLPKGAFGNFAEDFSQGGLSGMGYGGDIALAAASMGALNSAND